MTLRPCILVALALLPMGCSDDGESPQAPPSNGVTLLASPCPSGPGSVIDSRCLLLEVQPSGLNAKFLELRIIEPALGVPYVGTVVLCTGNIGDVFYSGLPGGSELISELRAVGLRVIDRRWIGGWMTPDYELKRQSERFALVLDWIIANEFPGGLFFAVGNSAGSGEIAFSLTAWNRENLFDGVVLGAGPPFSRLDYLCLPPTLDWAALCPSFVRPLECGVPPCTATTTFDSLCGQVSGMSAEEMLGNSVLFPGADTDFGTLDLHFVFGAADCTEWAPQAFLFESAIVSPHTKQLVPGTPHTIPTTAAGRDAIVQALLGFVPASASSQTGPWSTLVEDDGTTVTRRAEKER